MERSSLQKPTPTSASAPNPKKSSPPPAIFTVVDALSRNFPVAYKIGNSICLRTGVPHPFDVLCRMGGKARTRSVRMLVEGVSTAPGAPGLDPETWVAHVGLKG